MSEIEDMANLFQQHRSELGFVNTAQCREKDSYTVYSGDTILGAALCNHCVRKPQTTLYDIAVRPSARRQGVGTELVSMMATDSPHDVIVAKCPVNLDANSFYTQTEWEKVDVVEKEDKRDLNVWELDITDGW